MSPENKNPISPIDIQNQNQSQGQPEVLTVEGQAASLEAEIKRDKHDLDALIAKGDITPEEVEVFTADIDERQMLLSYFHNTLNQASGNLGRTPQDGFTSDSDNDRKQKTYPIKLDSIGWLDGKGSSDVDVEKIEHGDSIVYFGSVADQNRVTKSVADNLRASGEWDRLLETLKNEKLPKLWMDIGSGSRRIRPVSMGNRSLKEVEADNSMDTTYPAYKIDVHGTNNRALVMLAGKMDENPVFILAAMYDHDDQQAVLNLLFLKQK